MNPEIITCDDGLDIVIENDYWHTETFTKDNKTVIKFRKSNGKNPLSIKDITGIDFGQFDKPLGIDYSKSKTE